MRGGGHTIIDTLVIAVWDEPFIPFLKLKLMCTSINLVYYFNYTNARTALTLIPNAHLGFWYRIILEIGTQEGIRPTLDPFSMF